MIFDMDDTLVDTVKAIAPAIDELAPRHGLAPVSEEVIRDAVGIANPEFYYRFYLGHDQEKISAFGDEVSRAKERYVWQLGGAMLFAGMKEMLEKLSDMGLDMHIASTGDPDYVGAALKSAGIQNFFRSNQSGESSKERMVGEILGASERREWAMVGDRQKMLKPRAKTGFW